MITHKLAVYGTLKKDYCNYYFMKGCKYLGNGYTKDKFGMLKGQYEGRLAPKIFKGYDKGQVKVEVYEVSNDLLTGPLDYIENNGVWYQREEIDIDLKEDIHPELIDREGNKENNFKALCYIGLGDPGSEMIAEPDKDSLYCY